MSNWNPRKKGVGTNQQAFFIWKTWNNRLKDSLEMKSWLWQHAAMHFKWISLPWLLEITFFVSKEIALDNYPEHGWEMKNTGRNSNAMIITLFSSTVTQEFFPTIVLIDGHLSVSSPSHTVLLKILSHK